MVLLGKQGPCWTDPLYSQANSVVPYHPWEAPTSPSTRRRSGRSSFNFKSGEPLALADSWSQDTQKQPRGMRGTAAKLACYRQEMAGWGCPEFLNKTALRTCVFPCPLEPALSLLSRHRWQLHTCSHSCFACKSQSQEVLPKPEGITPRDTRIQPASCQISGGPLLHAGHPPQGGDTLARAWLCLLCSEGSCHAGRYVDQAGSPPPDSSPAPGDTCLARRPEAQATKR